MYSILPKSFSQTKVKCNATFKEANKWNKPFQLIEISLLYLQLCTLMRKLTGIFALS